jgi:hypothetical protein
MSFKEIYAEVAERYPRQCPVHGNKVNPNRMAWLDELYRELRVTATEEHGLWRLKASVAEDNHHRLHGGNLPHDGQALANVALATLPNGPQAPGKVRARYSRETLYDEVWSEPIQKVARRYGVSDVALAKTCRKLKIPLPGRGYWAKKTAGKPVEPRPPLSRL